MSSRHRVDDVRGEAESLVHALERVCRYAMCAVRHGVRERESC